MNDKNASGSPQSGYDLDVYGLDNGQFLYIHVPAMVCIVLSFICVVTAIVLSFRRKSWKTFFKEWVKSERFVVYLAICDGLFNVFHFTDHMHIVIVKDHVYPKELCEFYGFTLVVSILSQNLMVNVVAINAFMLMYFDRNLDFGKKDWKLLLWTFGVPFLAAIISISFRQLGPTGAFCYFDGVKGVIAKTFITTVAFILILVVNSMLYILTWWKIHTQTKGIQRTIRRTPSAKRSSQRAARSMSLFVAAFFIQWWSTVLYGIWDLAGSGVPQPVVHIVTTFTNTGGVLNLGVFLLIRRNQTRNKQKSNGKVSPKSSEEQTKENNCPTTTHANE